MCTGVQVPRRVVQDAKTWLIFGLVCKAHDFNVFLPQS